MERNVELEPGRTDGVLTPPLSEDSSLTELIEAELRTRLAHEQEADDLGVPEANFPREEMKDREDAISGERRAQSIGGQPESIMVVKRGGCDEPVMATDLHGQVPGDIAREEDSADERPVGKECVELGQESFEEQEGVKVCVEESRSYPEHGENSATDAVDTSEGIDYSNPDSGTNLETSRAPMEHFDLNTSVEPAAADQGAGSQDEEVAATLKSGSVVPPGNGGSADALDGVRKSNDTLIGGVAETSSEVREGITNDLDTEFPMDSDSAAEVDSDSVVQPRSEPVTDQASRASPAEDAQLTSGDVRAVEETSTTDDVIQEDDPAAGTNAEQPATKVSDDESDEGVEHGHPPRHTADANKPRRKPRSSAAETEPSRTGRSALDSEGDSDISSEGSSGASSLSRSQDSGAAPDRTRLSESSEPDHRLSESPEPDHRLSGSPELDHDDELADVNLRQLRTSYMTNFDTAKTSTRPCSKPDTGVCIKNLKNTYAGHPVPAARHGASATDSRPRDMTHITVNMASLRSLYSPPEQNKSAVPAQKPTAPVQKSVPAGVSPPSVRAAYVQHTQAQTQPPPPSLPSCAPPERPVQTGVCIDKLRTSWTDLSRAGEHLDGGALHPADSLKTACVNVSVKTLRASYGDLTQLSDAPGRDPETTRLDRTPRPAPRSSSIRDLRSAFGKDEPPADTTRIHVRSFDSSKAIKKFSTEPSEAGGSDCRSCGRRVFQMERISAEKAVWHKNCFRCCECSKQMTVDMYASDEGRLYCPVHHRQLMKERAVHHAEDAAVVNAARQKEAAHNGDGMSQNTEDATTAAEVVRASNKADYGLEDLQNLNVKDRFSVFERSNDEEERDREPANVEVKRSQSILNKMKKFQERREGGASSGDESSSETSGDEQRRDPDVVRSQRRYKKERPMSFSGMGDVKSRFEVGARREPAAPGTAAETQGELAKLRDMICGGSLRASYERAVQESGGARPASRQSPEEALPRGLAADITSRFESGSVSLPPAADQPPPSADQTPPSAPTENGAADANLMETLEAERVLTPDGEPAADTELLHSDTTKRMLNKFKQMEQSTGKTDEEVTVTREVAHGNAREVLSKFRQIQENALKEDLPDGPPPPKSFTPPPEDPATAVASDSNTADEHPASDPDIVRASHKLPDEFLNKRTDQARHLRDKFESWESRPAGDASFALEDDCRPSVEIARNMRAKFESLGSPQPKPAVEKTPHKASRFVVEPPAVAETCGACNKRVYAMERLEVDKRILHKNCFRCTKCNCVLRMDTYTFNAGQLFCVPHFKQLFKTKGNYDEGFGLESRTKRWPSNGHSEASSVNGGAASDAMRPEAEADDTNGASSPQPVPVNGVSERTVPSSGEDAQRTVLSSGEDEQRPVLSSGERADPHAEADVFQQVYESAVAEAI